MARISRTVEIQSTPEQVWGAMIDVEGWPRWATQVHSLKRQDAGAFGDGSRVRVTRKGLVGSVWIVTEYDVGHSSASNGRLALAIR